MFQTTNISGVMVTIAIAMFICGWVLFESLLATEYAEYRDDWEANGRPLGLFRLVEPGLRTSSLATRGLLLGWVFRTPRWAAGSKKVQLRMWLMRICFLGFLAIMIGMGVVQRWR